MNQRPLPVSALALAARCTPGARAQSSSASGPGGRCATAACSLFGRPGGGRLGLPPPLLPQFIIA